VFRKDILPQLIKDGLVKEAWVAKVEKLK
jgi:hypothetical protein